MIFVRLPVDPAMERAAGRSGDTLRAEYGEGGAIVRLDPDGTARVLTETFHSACDPAVSFDARRILFSAKKKPGDCWDIWEMDLDGGDALKITREQGNCRSPEYQSILYTLMAGGTSDAGTDPWQQIMFVSDVAGTASEYGGVATSLYSCTLEGAKIRRLTFNLGEALDPILMNDGRVLLACRQPMAQERSRWGGVTLYDLNIEGTDFALFCSDEGRRIRHMPCVTSDGLVVFVEADAIGWDGAGQLGSVTLRRPFHSYRPMTSDPATVYHSPSPLPGGGLLVSCRSAEGGGTFGIYRLDPRTGRKELVLDDPEFHDIQAKALLPRSRPDGRSSVLNESMPTGRLYCLNAYEAAPAMKPHLRPGTIKAVRVIEGVPLSSAGQNVSGRGAAFTRGGSDEDAAGRRRDITGEAPAPQAGRRGSSAPEFPSIVPKRLLGLVPVEEDGSFHVELPPDVPVQLQTLDADGLALATCGWIWVKPREWRGCVGCHEDPELTPENRFVQAVRKPAVQLTLPPLKRRSVDFQRDIMPILAAKCAACHPGERSKLDLRDERRGEINAAYETLVGLSDRPMKSDGGGSARGIAILHPYVTPGRARTSLLAWKLMGRGTARPWDAGAAAVETISTACPPPCAEQLTVQERRAIFEWIDLGAPWAGVPAPRLAVQTRLQEIPAPAEGEPKAALPHPAGVPRE